MADEYPLFLMPVRSVSIEEMRALYPTRNDEMQRFIGTKLINAKPMTRAEYNEFRGRGMPEDENGDDAGMLVEYLDGGKANTEEFENYVSWSPLDVFEKNYRPTTITSMTDYDFMEEAREMAAQCWGDSGTEKIDLDSPLVEAVAERIAIWVQTAAQNQRNTDYYRGLLEQCGKSIGDRAFIADDGTRSQDVLCAKLPEIIASDYVNPK